MKNRNLHNMILASFFAALTAVLSQIIFYIPGSPVPITFQVLSVALAGSILGSKWGFISQSVYVLIGSIGIPVFAGFNSGIAAIIGPKGGYIIGFPFMALIIGYIVDKHKNNSYIKYLLAMLSGLIILYVFGASWLAIVLKLNITQAVVMGVGWFLPFDIVKIAVGAYLAKRVVSALPSRYI